MKLLRLLARKGFDLVGMDGTWEPPVSNCSCLATASVSGANATETLDTVYQVRDTIMAQSSTGNYFISLFYQTTSQISILLDVNPELRSETGRLIRMFEPGFQNLLAGHGDDTVITQQMHGIILIRWVASSQHFCHLFNDKHNAKILGLCVPDHPHIYSQPEP